uniref:Uncharacterized protein n=1 Tax=Opuntia streptacantha TaxID=393608 RepID=A0A7C9E723_OPUST
MSPYVLAPFARLTKQPIIPTSHLLFNSHTFLTRAPSIHSLSSFCAAVSHLRLPHQFSNPDSLECCRFRPKLIRPINSLLPIFRLQQFLRIYSQPTLVLLCLQQKWWNPYLNWNTQITEHPKKTPKRKTSP